VFHAQNCIYGFVADFKRRFQDKLRADPDAHNIESKVSAYIYACMHSWCRNVVLTQLSVPVLHVYNNNMINLCIHQSPLAEALQQWTDLAVELCDSVLVRIYMNISQLLIDIVIHSIVT
jgi:hypothetical protein